MAERSTAIALQQKHYSILYAICTVHLCYLYRTFMLSVPYIYAICTVHLCYFYRTFMLFVPYIF
jgi:hypothetical protein